MFATVASGCARTTSRIRARPRFLDAVDNEALRLQRRPAGRHRRLRRRRLSTYWQNEDMDVDRDRKLVFMARDPRSFEGTTASDTASPASTSSTRATRANLRLITFHQLPTGHTTTCINDCDYLWTGGPASVGRPEARRWLDRRPADHRHRHPRPGQPGRVAATDRPVPQRRRDRVLARRAGRRRRASPGCPARRRARLLDRGHAPRPAARASSARRPRPTRSRTRAAGSTDAGRAVGSSCTTRSAPVGDESDDGPRPGLRPTTRRS